jgi:lysozyme
MPVVNDAALDLICEFEGFVPNWYPDPAHGWKVPTCCYGHTDAAGEPKYANTKNKTFTRAEGKAILERDLVQYANAVRAAVKVPLNPNQFGALTSFTYNLGAANLRKSTLVKKLNAGDYEGAANEFKRWNRAGGKVLAGLTRRRAAEAALFRSSAIPAPTPETPASEPPKPGNWVSALVAFIASIIRTFLRKK